MTQNEPLTTLEDSGDEPKSSSRHPRKILFSFHGGTLINGVGRYSFDVDIMMSNGLVMVGY